jgi:hypothetical protein
MHSVVGRPAMSQIQATLEGMDRSATNALVARARPPEAASSQGDFPLT